MKSFILVATLIVSASSYANYMGFEVTGKSFSCMTDCSEAGQKAIESAESRASAVCEKEGKTAEIVKSEISDTVVNTKNDGLRISAKTIAKCK